MSSVAYGIAHPASRGVLSAVVAPAWLPAGATIFADVPNARFWAGRRVWSDLASWLAAAGATFSGGAGRTYTNSANVLATAAANVPRISYRGGVPYLLYEPAATNRVTRSAEFDDAAWTKAFTATVVANQAIAPDGTMTADLMYAGSSGTFREMYQAAGDPGVQSTVSLYAKAAGINWLVLYDPGDQVVSWFNVSTGATGAQAGGVTSAVVALGNGWYRISTTRTYRVFTNYLQFGLADADNSRTITAVGTNGLYVWGAQFELGTRASSYIPTTASTATRTTEAISGLVAPGNLTVTFDDASTQALSATDFAAASNLTRPYIAKIAG